MYYKTSDKLNLHYEVHGNPNSKKYILFLNGLSQSTVAWLLMLPAFTNDYQIILCDFIFQGQSDTKASERSFDQHAADVNGLLDSLNIKKIDIAGISYGSLVAQHIALNYPEKVNNLILLSSFAHKTSYFEAISLAWQRALDTGGYSLMLDVMLPTVLSEAYFEHPLIPINILKNSRQTTNTDAGALNKLMDATYKRGDYREKLKEIKIPTIVIHGEKDALLPVHMGKAVGDSIPGSKFIVISGAGHTLNLEAVPQTVQLIMEFIQGPVKPLTIEKSKISELHFPDKEVLLSEDAIQQRKRDIERAILLGNNYKTKVKIIFADDEGIKQIKTTIWGITDKRILLNKALVIPINRIHEIKE